MTEERETSQVRRYMLSWQPRLNASSTIFDYSFHWFTSRDSMCASLDRWYASTISKTAFFHLSRTCDTLLSGTRDQNLDEFSFKLVAKRCLAKSATIGQRAVLREVAKWKWYNFFVETFVFENIVRGHFSGLRAIWYDSTDVSIYCTLFPPFAQQKNASGLFLFLAASMSTRFNNWILGTIKNRI